MSAVALTIQALLANGDVTYAVGDKVWPSKSAQGTTDSHIVVTLISETEPVLLQGSSGIATSRVRIDCRAPTATEAYSLGENVKNAFRNEVDVTVLSRTVSFAKLVSDTTGYFDTPNVSHRIMDFYVEWR